MEQKDIDAILQHHGFPTSAVLSAQIFNNGSFNVPLIRSLTNRGIIVKITFGQEHSDHYYIEIDPSKLEMDVSDTPFQVRWPADIARVLQSRGLTSTEALRFSSKIELKLLPGMTPRMLEYVMKELHKRQIFIDDYPSEERAQIVLSNSIEVLGLTRKIQQILLDERIYTLANLITWTPHALAQLAGLGPGSVTDINRKLESIGLKLNPNPFQGYANTRSQWRV